MKIHLLVVFSFLLLTPDEILGQEKPASQPPRCPGPVMPKHFDNPRLIANWLKTSGQHVKTIEDFVCCLPEVFQKQYIIGHSSLAAQNGTPNSPRVIMFDVEKALPTPKRMFAMSFNGGDHPYLTQAQSVEMMVLNPKTEELEFFDLEFGENRSPVLSERNPAKCMQCHGSYEKVPPGGPRPLFDPFAQWNRFVGGRNTCSDTERDFFKKVDTIAVDAIKKGGRFRCLSHEALSTGDLFDRKDVFFQQFQNLASFDADLNELNQRRVSRLVRSYESFRRLRHGLFGLDMCGGSFKDWLPDDVVRTLANSPALSKEFKEKDWLKNARLRIDEYFTGMKRFETKAKHALQANSIAPDREIEPPSIAKFVATCPTKEDMNNRLARLDPKASTKFPMNMSGEAERGSAADRDLLARFEAQEQLVNRRGQDPLLQFIFASLGENVDFWEMSPTGADAPSGLTLRFEGVLSDELKANYSFRKGLEKYFDVKPVQGEIRFGGPRRGRYGGLQVSARNGEDSCGAYKAFVQASYKGTAPASSELLRGVRQTQ